MSFTKKELSSSIEIIVKTCLEKWSLLGTFCNVYEEARIDVTKETRKQLLKVWTDYIVIKVIKHYTHMMGH